MTRCVFGRAEADVERKLVDETADEILDDGGIVGTASEVVDLLVPLAEAGVERVMLQWFEVDDIDGLETLAHEVLPQLR